MIIHFSNNSNPICNTATTVWSAPRVSDNLSVVTCKRCLAELNGGSKKTAKVVDPTEKRIASAEKALKAARKDYDWFVKNGQGNAINSRETIIERYAELVREAEAALEAAR